MNNRIIEFNVSFISFIRKLDRNEIKLFYFLLNKVNWNNEETTLKISIFEIYELFKLNHSESNKEIIDSYFKRITNLQISCKEAIFNIFYSIQYDQSFNVNVEVSPFLKRNFDTLLKTLAIVPLELLGQFKSNQSAFLFWKLCEEFCKNTNTFNFSVTFTTEELKKIFNIGEDQYINTAQSNNFLRTTFEKQVLNKSIDEINNSNIGMKVSYFKIKGKKMVKGYCFDVYLNNIDKIYRQNLAENMRIQLFGRDDEDCY